MSALTFCQDTDVPNAVIEAFQEKFPDAEGVTWKQLKTNYQVTFEDEETTMVQFSPEGKWVKTVVIVTEDELPGIAAEHIEEYFEETEILQVQMIENNKGEITFHVVLLDGDEKMKINFNDEGIVIEK